MLEGSKCRSCLRVHSRYACGSAQPSTVRVLGTAGKLEVRHPAHTAVQAKSDHSRVAFIATFHHLQQLAQRPRDVE